MCITLAHISLISRPAQEKVHYSHSLCTEYETCGIVSPIETYEWDVSGILKPDRVECQRLSDPPLRNKLSLGNIFHMMNFPVSILFNAVLSLKIIVANMGWVDDQNIYQTGILVAKLCYHCELLLCTMYSLHITQTYYSLLIRLHKW